FLPNSSFFLTCLHLMQYFSEPRSMMRFAAGGEEEGVATSSSRALGLKTDVLSKPTLSTTSMLEYCTGQEVVSLNLITEAISDHRLAFTQLQDEWCIGLLLCLEKISFDIAKLCAQGRNPAVEGFAAYFLTYRGYITLYTFQFSLNTLVNLACKPRLAYSNCDPPHSCAE